MCMLLRKHQTGIDVSYGRQLWRFFLASEISSVSLRVCFHSGYIHTHMWHVTVHACWRAPSLWRRKRAPKPNSVPMDATCGACLFVSRAGSDTHVTWMVRVCAYVCVMCVPWMQASADESEGFYFSIAMNRSWHMHVGTWGMVRISCTCLWSVWSPNSYGKSPVWSIMCVSRLIMLKKWLRTVCNCVQVLAFLDKQL